MAVRPAGPRGLAGGEGSWGSPCLRGTGPGVGGLHPRRGTLTSSKKERVLTATERLWAPTPCAPRRCSTSDTVPMRCATWGSLFRKKPLRKYGSCLRSRLPCRGWAWRAPRAGVPRAPQFLPCRPDPETQAPPATCLPGRSPGLCACTGSVSLRGVGPPWPQSTDEETRPGEVKSCVPNHRAGRDRAGMGLVPWTPWGGGRAPATGPAHSPSPGGRGCSPGPAGSAPGPRGWGP